MRLLCISAALSFSCFTSQIDSTRNRATQAGRFQTERDGEIGGASRCGLQGLAEALETPL
jgi:hypothetical protein